MNGKRSWLFGWRLGLWGWGLPTLLVAQVASGEGPERLVEIVLRVNDRIATRYDYEDRKAARIEAIANQPNLSTEELRKLANEAGKAVAREMFEELLLLSRGDELRIRPTEAQIEAAIEATRERMGLRDPEEFRAALEATGWTLEEFRRRLRVQLVTSEVVDREVRSKLKLDDDLLVRRYQAQPERWQRPERRRIVELVVREEAFNGNWEEARKVAEQVAARWRAGSSESEILKEFDSKGVSGPVEHGWVAPGELAPELETVAFRLEAGGVSDPVFARGVLHVVRVSDIEPAGRIPFAEVKDRLRAEEGRRLLEERLQSYLQELASRAYVVDRLPPEAQGFRDLGSRPEMDEALSLLKPERKAAPAEGSGVASENPSPEGSPPNTP